MKFKDFKDDLRKNVSFNISNNSDNLNVHSYLPYEKTPRTSINYLRYAVVSLAMLFLVGMGGFLYLNLNPVSYLQIEVNPSIELELNRFNRVVDVNSINGDGVLVEENLNLKYKSLDEALDLIYDYYLSEGLGFEDNLYVLYGIDADIKVRYEINQKINEAKPDNVKAIVLAGNFNEVEFNGDQEMATPMTPDDSFDYNSGGENSVPAIEQGRNYTEIVSDYEISQLRLNLVIMIFNALDDYTTEADFILLLEMEINELYELYENIEA